MFSDSFTMDRAPRAATREGDDSSRALRENSRSVSPCSSAALAAVLPDERFTLTDLAAQFAGQRLRRDAQICYDPCDSYANLDDDDAGWQIDMDEDEDDDSLQFDVSNTFSAPLSRARTCPARPHSPTQRMQRQVNARLLCSATHHRDIATLVAKMVSAQDQCSVVSAPLSSTSPATLSPLADDDSDAISIDRADSDHTDDDDEGYKSGSNSTSRRESVSTTRCSSSASLASLSAGSVTSRPRADTYRRASDRRHTTSASVCKSVRFRRESRPSHVRSRCVTDAGART